jgi:hypothetical protein
VHGIEGNPGKHSVSIVFHHCIISAMTVGLVKIADIGQ